MNKLELRDNGEFLDIFVNGEKRGLTSKTRPLAHIVRSIYHLIPDSDFAAIEQEVRRVLLKEVD